MSTLVGYESSSDEDNNVGVDHNPSVDFPAIAEVGIDAASLMSNGRGGQQQETTPVEAFASTNNTKLPIGPMVGPAMKAHPDEGVSQDIQADEETVLSERDAVRYLTQASHPMTSIPPSPPGSPDRTVDAKFQRFVQLKAKGVHFNDDLGQKATFRNPGLLSTLMERAGVEADDQHKTSIPLTLWDPLDLPPHAYKEELLLSQQSLREQQQANKKSLAATGKRAIEFTSGGTSGSNSRSSTPGNPSKRKRG